MASDEDLRKLLTGQAAELPGWEQEIIMDVARREGVDPAALASLRIIENGGPGREFGVLSVPAPTYTDQATIAARSLKNHEQRYRDRTGEEPKGADAKYTEAFLRDFSARWAPIGAENDPRGLNNFHAGNLIAIYERSGTA